MTLTGREALESGRHACQQGNTDNKRAVLGSHYTHQLGVLYIHNAHIPLPIQFLCVTYRWVITLFYSERQGYAEHPYTNTTIPIQLGKGGP